MLPGKMPMLRLFLNTGPSKEPQPWEAGAGSPRVATSCQVLPGSPDPGPLPSTAPAGTRTV